MAPIRYPSPLRRTIIGARRSVATTSTIPRILHHLWHFIRNMQTPPEKRWPEINWRRCSRWDSMMGFHQMVQQPDSHPDTTIDVNCMTLP